MGGGLGLRISKQCHRRSRTHRWRFPRGDSQKIRLAPGTQCCISPAIHQRLFGRPEGPLNVRGEFSDRADCRRALRDCAPRVRAGPSATITGQSKTSGWQMPGALATLISETRGTSQTAVTDERGDFTFSNIAGHLHLRIRWTASRPERKGITASRATASASPRLPSKWRAETKR